MDYIEALEQAVQYNKMLREDNINVAYVVTKFNNEDVNCHIVHNNTKEDFNIEITDSYKAIKQKALKLTEPRFIKPSSLCVNIIGKKLYIDKKTEITVESIHNGYIIDTDDVEHNIDTLWLKE